jgi:cystathionine beta-synthase
MSGRAERHARPYDSVLETIGWTPLIRLNSVTDGARTPVLAKAEFFNPGGSVKDRVGLAMIEAAERDGRLRPGGVVVEGTSGNTGVGLAIAAALKGYRCIFTMPDKMSQEKVRLLKAFGAEVIITPTAVPPDHPDNYVQTAKRIVENTPGAVLADQFYNAVNPEAHYATTGPEIWAQTDGRITHLVASAGTGGTISGVWPLPQGAEPGCARHRRATRWAPSSPPTSHRREGRGRALQGGRDRQRQAPVHPLVRCHRRVPFRPRSRRLPMARRLTREEGLFVGGSAGLITHLAVRCGRELDDPDALIVAILPIPASGTSRSSTTRSGCVRTG